VHVLAELGESDAIPTLISVGQNGHLKDTWSEQLKAEVGVAIAKIKARK